MPYTLRLIPPNVGAAQPCKVKCSASLNRIGLLVGVVVIVATSHSLPAADIQANSLPSLDQALATATPGDQIILADGQYDSTAPITVAVAGTAAQPIIITAKTVGGVEIRGEARFQLTRPAAYVVIQGFVFTHQAGEMSLEDGVHHCRITRNVFELPVTGRARYLAVSGDDVEIDYNEFRNKSTEGQMLQVEGPGESEMAQRTWIHHNYFHDFKNSRRNNSSALHIGSSTRSMSSAWSIVEHNLFVRTTGENEGAICNKSSDNLYRYNTLGERSSELSLRHGKRCLVYGNYFLGSSGIRFFSQNHRIYSNYFENCRPAVEIGNGGATIPPGPLTSHERPDHVEIVYNTLVNNRANVRMSRRRRGLGANNLVFANNLIVGAPQAVTIEGPLADPTWEGNILWQNDGGPGDIPASGFTELDPQLSAEQDGRFPIRDGSPLVGNGVGTFAYVKTDIDGQPRGPNMDVGADELSSAPKTNRVLTPADVGPNAPTEDRPWITAPKLDVEWIASSDTPPAQ